VGVSFGGGTGGGVWLLVSTASAALYIHYSVYVLEPRVGGVADKAGGWWGSSTCPTSGIPNFSLLSSALATC
jgi:hypothetical protein